MPVSLLLALAIPTVQQTPFDTLVYEAVATHGRSVAVEDGHLTGPGGAWLLDRAGAARFTLIGESHLNVETPAFTEALLRGLASRGYSVYAAETGPESTRLLVDTLRAGGFDAGAALMARLPFSIAFVDHREELQVIASALDMGYEVWGIDQEFIGGARFLLRRLAEIAPDQASRAVAEDFLAQAMEGFRKFAEEGDQSAAFMMTATDEDFERLAEAFAQAGPEAQRIVEGLHTSWAIYRAFHEQRYYDNNSTRVELIRRNFLRHFGDAPGDALAGKRVVLRAGSVHAGRGRTPMHVYDVGSLAAEIAFLGGLESLHLVVLARASIGADGAARDWAEDSPHLVPLYAAMGRGPAEEHAQEGEDGAMVFDLRPLRALLTTRREKSEALEELQDLALRFDAAVIVPLFHPAERIMPGGTQ